MDHKSRAQRIAEDILASERYAKTHAFDDHVYRDEPIIRTGAQILRERARKRSERESLDKTAGRVTERRARDDAQVTQGGTRVFRRGGDVPEWARIPDLFPPQDDEPKRERLEMPERYRKMRALGRTRAGWGSSYAGGGSKLFFEQGKLMEDFEDDFDGRSTLQRYYPTYDEMSDYELRCYFSWRTRLREWGEHPEGGAPLAPTSFLFVHAYEILCGIGVEPGMKGYGELCGFARAYAGTSTAFDTHLMRWKHDYVVFHGLDKSLLAPPKGSFPLESVALLRQAERALLAQKDPGVWPEREGEGVPSREQLLDALISLSRYRADRSRFFKDRREDVAFVCAHVFALMVNHCHKRRKTDFVTGLFGSPTKMTYTMYPSALFWAPEPHADTVYVASEAESYVCERGFWWRVCPCRRMYTSKELGALLHAIDARMRLAMSDAHPLKERPLPKYQGKFIDDQISALLERKKAEEAARIDIDRGALGSIRSAATRTREALLTDDEREDEEELSIPTPEPVVAVPTQSSSLGLDDDQAQLLQDLVEGRVPEGDALFLTLAVDAINEVFLDVVGDTVIEFDGAAPVLVEDYAQDVRDALFCVHDK